MLCAVIV